MSIPARTIVVIEDLLTFLLGIIQRIYPSRCCHCVPALVLSFFVIIWPFVLRAANFFVNTYAREDDFVVASNKRRYVKCVGCVAGCQSGGGTSCGVIVIKNIFINSSAPRVDARFFRDGPPPLPLSPRFKRLLKPKLTMTT